MSDAVDDLCALLVESGARVTFDRERSIALPCFRCGKVDVPRTLAPVGTWTVATGRGAVGSRIMRPMCEECVTTGGSDGNGE